MRLAARLRRELDEGLARDLDLLGGDMPDIQGAATPAAVLVAVTDRPEPGLLLTLRPETMRSHAGQVAFPGGRIDPEDDGPVAAALREAEEEIGLPRDLPEVVGIADPYRTGTGFSVIPVLAVVPPDLPLVANDAEVAALFEVGFEHVLDRANQAMREAEFRGRLRHYYEIMWQDYRIWGATAAMLVNLSRRLGRA